MARNASFFQKYLKAQGIWQFMQSVCIRGESDCLGGGEAGEVRGKQKPTSHYITIWNYLSIQGTFFFIQ